MKGPPVWSESNTIDLYEKVYGPNVAEQIVKENENLHRILESLGFVFRDTWHILYEGYTLEFVRTDDLRIRADIQWDNNQAPIQSLRLHFFSPELIPNVFFNGEFSRLYGDSITACNITYLLNIIKVLKPQVQNENLPPLVAPMRNSPFRTNSSGPS